MNAFEAPVFGLFGSLRQEEMTGREFLVTDRFPPTDGARVSLERKLLAADAASAPLISRRRLSEVMDGSSAAFP